MKKYYQKPEMTIVSLQQAGIICGSIKRIDGGDTGIGYGGGGSGPARGRRFGDGDDDWND